MTRALLLLLLAPAAAHAQSHSVGIRNGGPETIRSIQVGPAGSLGENRMRSQLPPGAEARIGYSTGCTADVRIGYASGRTEDHAGVDICGGPGLVAGTNGIAGPTLAATPASASTSSKPATTVAATLPVKAPPPVVPPWTGKSITKRFGGME